MPLILERFVILTPLHETIAGDRIAALLGPPPGCLGIMLSLPTPSNARLTGRRTGNVISFRVLPAPWHRDSFYPRCIASIDPTPSGSAVTLHVGLSGIEAAFFLVFALMAVYLALTSSLPALVIATLVLLGVAFAMYIQFAQERDRIKDVLKTALEAANAWERQG